MVRKTMVLAKGVRVRTFFHLDASTYIRCHDLLVPITKELATFEPTILVPTTSTPTLSILVKGPTTLGLVVKALVVKTFATRGLASPRNTMWVPKHVLTSENKLRMRRLCYAMSTWPTYVRSVLEP